MPLSFYISLILWIITCVPIFKDHGKTFRELKVSKGKQKAAAFFKLLWLWTPQALALTVAVVTACESAKSDTQTELLRKRADDLEERARPRHLTASKRIALIRQLATFPKVEIEMNALTSDHESSDFALEIANALAEAQFSVKAVPILAGYLDRGITIGDSKSPPDSPILKELKAAFAAAGLSVTNAPVPWGLDGQVIIRVGPKY